MPNWVFNNITVYGDDKKLDKVQNRLKAEYKGVENGDVNFLNFIAPPEENWEEYNTVGVPGLSTEDKENHPVFNWYDWHCDNWGTKWNACDPSVNQHNNELLISFQTAWSPPRQFMDSFFAYLVELGLEAHYTWEEEQGFGANLSLIDGKVELTEEWDMPTSHADFEDRDNQCPCEMWEEEMYDDCPKVEVDA